MRGSFLVSFLFLIFESYGANVMHIFDCTKKMYKIFYEMCKIKVAQCKGAGCTSGQNAKQTSRRSGALLSTNEM
jgi:hypothetical protein